MKICFLVRSLPCHLHGGLEYHTITLANALAQLGHSIVILTTQHEDGNPCPFKYDNLEIIHLPYTRPGKYTASFFYQTIKTLKEIKDIDIVHSQGFAGFGYMFVKKFPLVTTIHGTLTSETNLFYENSLKAHWIHRKRIILHPLYRLLLKISTQVLVDSRFSRELVVSDFPSVPNKVKTVPLGIDTNLFNVHDKQESRKQLNLQEQFTILVLGRFAESKGFQVVIQALTQLADLPVSLIIAGEGHYRSHLESMVHAKQLNNISFLGAISPEKIPHLYNSCDLFIHPDLTAPAFGLVAVEAMACGLPVIATQSGALPEIVSPDTGFLFPRGDIEQLATLIRFLYDDTALRKEMGRSARSRVEKFYDAKRMALETAQIYQNITGIFQ